MNIFELIFLAVFLIACVKLVRVIFAAIDKHKTRFTYNLQQLAAIVFGYLGVVILVSLLTPGKVLNIGDQHCTNDWCATVDGVKFSYNDSLWICTVTLKITSRRHRMPWREKYLQVYILDGHGRRYNPIPNPNAEFQEKNLKPKKSTTICEKFSLPQNANALGLVISRRSFPGLFVIGDEESLLQKRTMIHLK